MASGCPNLQTVIANEFPTLLDDCIMVVAEKCPKVHTVSLLGCPLLTDECFKRLAQNKNLQVLKIDGNHRVSDNSLKQLGRMCPDLRHVYVADCQRLTDATLKALSSCKNLTVLNLADCVRISDAGVRHLMDGPAAAKLRELNLTNCVRVGDMAMVNVHKRCHNLTYLNVNFCEHISEAGIELLGQIHSLVALDVSGCNCGDQNLTDGAIKNLAFCCRMLTVLNLAGCKHVTDLSIQYLSGVCHYLTQLDISGCIHISDKALKYLRKGCKKLRCLNMLYCKKITK
ncbi:F-box/LRR-repeat protein 13-like [Elysia marginata]|uniref:F-box/LRR-repeat protein 13-like n=1 Tax=Elysia marginata TaxID=1093978 RepID=A0AAV4FME2_9GAST|nr:F-box/LRR-repeat protein 13-like [Elysia marginata]